MLERVELIPIIKNIVQNYCTVCCICQLISETTLLFFVRLEFIKIVEKLQNVKQSFHFYTSFRYGIWPFFSDLNKNPVSLESNH